MKVTLIDGHVHFYEHFGVAAFCDMAAQNFEQHLPAGGSTGVLLMASTRKQQPLALLDLLTNSPPSGWTSHRLEATAIALSHPKKQRLVIVAGRQLVTSEGLEVLSLCCDNAVVTGRGLNHTVLAVSAAGGVPVVSWGFGKWWFERGRRVRQFLSQEAARSTKPNWLLGDNGGRPRWLASPDRTLSPHENWPVLAGSDPLPLPNHVCHVGTYGNVVHEPIDLQRPTEWLKSRLLNSDLAQTFGTTRDTIPIVVDQLKLRLNWQQN